MEIGGGGGGGAAFSISSASASASSSTSTGNVLVWAWRRTRRCTCCLPLLSPSLRPALPQESGHGRCLEAIFATKLHVPHQKKKNNSGNPSLPFYSRVHGLFLYVRIYGERSLSFITFGWVLSTYCTLKKKPKDSRRLSHHYHESVSLSVNKNNLTGSMNYRLSGLFICLCKRDTDKAWLKLKENWGFGEPIHS